MFVHKIPHNSPTINDWSAFKFTGDITLNTTPNFLLTLYGRLHFTLIMYLMLPRVPSKDEGKIGGRTNTKGWMYLPGAIFI